VGALGRRVGDDQPDRLPLSGRAERDAAPRSLAAAPPGPPVAAAAACDGRCPPGVTAASVLVASDLRTRIDALPAATSKLDN